MHQEEASNTACHFQNVTFMYIKRFNVCPFVYLEVSNLTF